MSEARCLGAAAAALTLFAVALPVSAQSFRAQCPAGTLTHPAIVENDPSVAIGDRPKYATITQWGRTDGLLNPTPAMANPHIKCQQISGGDGYATMGDGTQTYLFAFGPLSGLADIVQGKAATQPATVFNQNNLDNTGAVLDVVKIGAPYPGYTFNGAIGLVPDVEVNAGTGTSGAPLDGHVDARLVMDVGVMNGNQPAPLIVIDEGDELFLTLTNVGMVMRPDLFEQHTVHFHGYPNASAFYDGVPDASAAINIGGSFTYYYIAPEPGTYIWHCHISPPEHLQMGMVGQLYVRPRQNTASGSLYAFAKGLQASPATRCSSYDILCSDQLPTADNGASATGVKYAYNDGDGSTAYDVEYPVQMMGFDPNFHFVGMTFNPESFFDTKDKYFLLNGRSYPDTIGGHECSGGGADPVPACAGQADGTVVPGPMSTQASDGTNHFSQPLPTVINIPLGGRALLRFSDLNVTEYHTLASLGIPMHVIGFNARLLRDQDGNNTDYYTNSINLGGGESVDVILDASLKDGSGSYVYPAGSKYYLYTPQLDHLSNDAENFGGMMTEVNICPVAKPVVDPNSRLCVTGP
jgi:FtsP/CotA-like multicopper oxidase with cupredoxin domain